MVKNSVTYFMDGPYGTWNIPAPLVFKPRLYIFFVFLPYLRDIEVYKYNLAYSHLKIGTLSIMSKCIMVKIGGEAKKRKSS